MMNILEILVYKTETSSIYLSKLGGFARSCFSYNDDDAVVSYDG